MHDDPLLAHFDKLVAKAQAWQTSWAQRGETASASVANLVSATYLGETLGQQIETRLLAGRREIDNELARYAGMVAAGIALLCRAGDTSTLERQTHEAFLNIGQVEDGFETKLAELRPLVELYGRLRVALGPAKTTG